MFLILLIILFYNLTQEYQKYTLIKKLKIFNLFNKYYLKKYLFFIIWKDIAILSIISQTFYYKYKILIFIHLIFITIGFCLFHENLYDFFFFENQKLDLMESVYKDLEPPFGDIKVIDNKPVDNKIQKKNLLYNFLSITVLCFLLIK